MQVHTREYVNAMHFEYFNSKSNYEQKLLGGIVCERFAMQEVDTKIASDAKIDISQTSNLKLQFYFFIKKKESKLI